jgi:hypothetical protein
VDGVNIVTPNQRSSGLIRGRTKLANFFCCHPALCFLLEILLLSGTLGNHLARRDACQGDSSQTHIQKSYRSFS